MEDVISKPVATGEATLMPSATLAASTAIRLDKADAQTAAGPTAAANNASVIPGATKIDFDSNHIYFITSEIVTARRDCNVNTKQI